MPLRPYQQEAINGLYNWFEANDEGNPLVVVPTGGGKSHIIAEFLRGAYKADPSQRFVILSHRKEILQQNAQKLVQAWPGVPLGIFSAGLGQKKVNRVTFSGIQSAYKKADRFGHIDLAIIDEAHLINARKDDTQYMTFLDGLRKQNPHLRLVGFTATPFRLKTGLLFGPDELFSDVAYDIPILRLIEEGFLSPLLSKAGLSQADLSAVRIKAGEYVEKDSAEALDRVTAGAVQEIVTLGAERKSWLVFCCNLDHVSHVAAALQQKGISVRTVTGKTPKEERTSNLEDFKAGKYRALINCDVLTTGFDAPNVDLIALLRPTQSPGLYVQMLGRGSRLSPGKSNCLVLDFAGNLERHGPLDKIKAVRTKAGISQITKGATKTCGECQTVMPIQARECPDCGHEVVAERIFRPNHDTKASAAPLFSNEIKEAVVTGVDYFFHQSSPLKTPTMRVVYDCGGLLQVREWICFQHKGFPQRKAHTWWKERSISSDPPPVTIDEAIARAGELIAPSKLYIQHERSNSGGLSFYKILSTHFAPNAKQELLETNQILEEFSL